MSEAYLRGYTEPNPRDDFSGVDVCRKLVVLARTVGFNVGMIDVMVEPFIPVQFLFEENPDRFVGKAKELDGYFSRKIERLRNDETIRYVASILAQDTPKIRVSTEEVSKTSPLGSLEGSLNEIIITTEAYPLGHSIKAAGAGLLVTARNIRNDLLDLLPSRRIGK